MAEWCTIESDPGVFTELIRNIGVKGVQVEEILDLDILGYGNEPVYGLIFLFKYIPNSGYSPNVLPSWDEDLYFAKQVIINACATQAILAVLMNNDDKIDIGTDLQDLKNFTRQMDPELKGLSISNSENIRREHNKFAKPEPFVFSKTGKVNEKEDVFHFVAYLHHKNNIYEVDGLREGPILIEENVSNENWINKVKPCIISRINLYSANEIKFNLLAVVPDRRIKAMEQISELEKRRPYIQNLIAGSNPEDNPYPEYNSLTKEELLMVMNEFDSQMANLKMLIEDENEKFEKYKLENERRQHNYIPLIYELLKIMSEKNALESVYEEAKKEEENRNRK